MVLFQQLHELGCEKPTTKGTGLPLLSHLKELHAALSLETDLLRAS